MQKLVLRTVLPALLAIGLFCGVVFLYFLPTLSRAVLDQKRLMIRELTESSWNILARFEAEERAGLMTREQAQAAAIAQVRNLHYGQEGKDYFWINDLQPRMIVHPYRPDLEGRDLSDFADPHGKLMFVEMADLVRREGAGYVRYMWQWKDDPDRIVPKLSYVKGFAPWGWIIGTGVYTEDIDAELAAISGRLQAAALLILAVVSLLLFVLLRTSFQAERGRLRATAALQASEEKYRSLVESAGESIFMSVGGQGLFANASMLRLVGHDRASFARLDVADLVRPTAAELESGRRHWEAVVAGDRAPTRYEAELATSDGRTVRAMIALSRVVLQGQAGFMAVATPLAQPRELDLAAAAGPEDLAAAGASLRTMASLMMSHGADALQVCRLLSSSADTAARRAMELATGELGPPPVPCDLLLMGSLGRAEVTLTADQDHALIYADPEAAAAGAQDVQRYFLALGARISTLLDAAGYPRCPGGIMAGEERCCQPLAGWRATFAAWIHKLEADDLLQTTIFFDFRGVLGEPALAEELRAHQWRELAREPRFVHMLARSVLQYEPPLGLFGGLALERSAGGKATFDVKGVLAQIVDFVRLRALQHGVGATGTLERIEALAAAGHLHPETARTTADAFTFLLELRLRHQARRSLDRLEPDNHPTVDRLAADEVARLKAVFGHIKVLQTALDHEFRGA